ncbi:MAG TPA: wax ester/triacylglycerol synthase family O-acyltransferase [Solirubrobacterales bacterium]|nr:wax ester/triacylglycerol synthase family O-acyltransferase [Solirubrobacterales bacterium]
MAQGHLERLTSFDASFLATEKAGAHMAIGAVLSFAGAAPSQEEFVAQVRSRLHLLPRLRQRLLGSPLRLGTPYWVDHADFAVEEHVARMTLPMPGSDTQLREVVGQLLAPPLDRSKPLWQLILVDGLAEDRFVVVYKTHHAMADGVSAVDIGMLLFDAEPHQTPIPGESPWSPQPTPSKLGLVARAAAGVVTALRRMGTWFGRALRDPSRARRRAGNGLAGLWEVTSNLFKPAPKVPLNVSIGSGRCFDCATFDLADFKRIKNAYGGTVNDVALAVVAGGMRRWLSDRQVSLTALELKALVPVSVRTEDEHGKLGNKLTAMRGPLPVGIADPVARLRAVSEAMDALKASKQPFGAEAIWGLNDWFRDFAPPLLLNPTAAVNFSTRLFNLLVTNFPGPQMPFYLRGRELTEIHPVGFLARRHALAIAILSYNGKVGFGLLADPDALPDLDRIPAYLAASLQELREPAHIASRDDADELAGDSRPGFTRGRERLL